MSLFTTFFLGVIFLSFAIVLKKNGDVRGLTLYFLTTLVFNLVTLFKPVVKENLLILLDPAILLNVCLVLDDCSNILEDADSTDKDSFLFAINSLDPLQLVKGKISD